MMDEERFGRPCLEEDAFWLCSASLEIDTQRDLYLVRKGEFQIW